MESGFGTIDELPQLPAGPGFKCILIMFINYLKTGWRNTLRNKLYSLVNISGLAIGLSVAILIGIWVWDELSFDKNQAAKKFAK